MTIETLKRHLQERVRDNLGTLQQVELMIGTVVLCGSACLEDISSAPGASIEITMTLADDISIQLHQDSGEELTLIVSPDMPILSLKRRLQERRRMENDDGKLVQLFHGTTKLRDGTCGDITCSAHVDITMVWVENDLIHCEDCEMELNGDLQYEDHVQGKKHRKNKMRKLKLAA